MGQALTVFDGHNDVLLRLSEAGDFFQRHDTGHIDLPRAREGGLGGGFCAVFIRPQGMGHDEVSSFEGKTPDRAYAWEAATGIIGRLFQIEAESQGRVKVVRTVEELASSLNQGVFAALLHMEGAEAIDPGLEALPLLYQSGLRSLGPVWSRPNAFGCGVPFRFPHSPDTGPGLTAAGRELVRACNQLGIMIDLSHLNEQGFWDVAALSDAPLVATHSNAHAITPSTRNLTDRQLAAIAESDGMVGVNFAVGFLREDGANDAETPLDAIVRHIDYLVEHLGIDRVGFGSDFDGAHIPRELGDAAGLPKLISRLREHGYDDTALRKVTHENWLRVLGKTWKN